LKHWRSLSQLTTTSKFRVSDCAYAREKREAQKPSTARRTSESTVLPLALGDSPFDRLSHSLLLCAHQLQPQHNKESSRNHTKNVAHVALNQPPLLRNARRWLGLVQISNDRLRLLYMRLCSRNNRHSKSKMASSTLQAAPIAVFLVSPHFLVRFWQGWGLQRAPGSWLRPRKGMVTFCPLSLRPKLRVIGGHFFRRSLLNHQGRRVGRIHGNHPCDTREGSRLSYACEYG